MARARLKRISLKRPKRSRKKRMARTAGMLRTLKKSARKSYVDETDYLLRSPTARALLTAIAEADAGKFVEHELIDE